MKKTANKRAPRGPRDVSDTVWYYVNRASVDVVFEDKPHAICKRLTRKTLLRMLAELKPVKKS